MKLNQLFEHIYTATKNNLEKREVMYKVVRFLIERRNEIGITNDVCELMHLDRDIVDIMDIKFCREHGYDVTNVLLELARMDPARCDNKSTRKRPRSYVDDKASDPDYVPSDDETDTDDDESDEETEDEEEKENANEDDPCAQCVEITCRCESSSLGWFFKACIFTNLVLTGMNLLLTLNDRCLEIV